MLSHQYNLIKVKMQSITFQVKLTSVLQLFTITTIILVCNAGPRLDEPCDINGMDGTCKRLNDCPRVKHLLETRDILPKLCALKNIDVVVCCVTETQDGISKRLQKCESYGASLNRSTCDVTPIGSDMVAITEFPHIAAIGYQSSDLDYASNYWLCHGSLVSSRFVMTAAHCLQNPTLRPVKVRLGSPELTTLDWQNPPIDRTIDKIIVHPEYHARKYYNDIGLVKLSHRVEFSRSVRPICLPETNIESSIYYRVNYEPDIQKNRYTRPLRKYKLQSVTNERCNESYRNTIDRRLGAGLNDGLLCMLVVEPNDLNADECTGYSGAPIQIFHPSVACSYIQLGIVSFGVGCDDQIPGGVTRVYNYMEWIESIIWV